MKRCGDCKSMSAMNWPCGHKEMDHRGRLQEADFACYLFEQKEKTPESLSE